MRLVEDISFAAGAVTCSGGHVEAVFVSTVWTTVIPSRRGFVEGLVIHRSN